MPSASGSRFFLWAEDAYKYTHKRGRFAVKSVPRHPFQSPLDEVAHFVSPDDRPEEMTCHLLLPSTPEQGPLPSPDLGVHAPGALPELRPWSITGVGLPPDTASLWLAAVPATPEQGYEGYGSDLLVWRRIARFALELLARQRFVPSIDADQMRAQWRLLLTDPADQQRRAALAAALPGICCAVVPSRQTKDSDAGATPEALVASFLQTCGDALIRSWLGEEHPPRKLSQPATPQWLAALRAPNPAPLRDRASACALQAQVQSWFGPLLADPSTELSAAFRTCLRLEAPGEDDAPDAPWSLRILLQAVDDPSLLVPATAVWQERGATLQYLNRRFERPQERLLADLATLARHFPPLGQVLHTAQPEVCLLTPFEVTQFLREAALKLQEQGFGVLLPANLDTTADLAVRARVKSPPGGVPGSFGLADLLEVDWELVLGQGSLSRTELRRLARLKVPLVQVRGQWVQVDPTRLAGVLRTLERQGDRLSVGTALRLAAGAGKALADLPIAEVQAEGGAADLLQQLQGEAHLTELPPPAGLNATLRPYQVRGFSWLTFLRLRGIGACLADDMGLGKTIQVITLLLHERAMGLTTGPTLLICPTSLVSNWQRELARFAPGLQVLVHYGSGRAAREELAAAAAAHDVVISTYALVYRDLAAIGPITWAGIVLDEAQNIKNADSRQSQSIRCLEAGYRIALSGTPLENRLSELWSILDFLNPDYLGSQADFQKRFATPIERRQDAAAAAQLRKLVQPFILRRVKTDPAIISDLPPKQEMEVLINLTAEQATLYAAVVEEMLSKIEGADDLQRRGLVFSALTQLKQICNHPAHFLGDGSALPERSGKLNRLTEMLEDVVAEGDRALIFTQYAEMGSLLQQHLAATFGQEVPFLHGGVPRTARSAMVQRFQEDADGPQLFILSLKAGGVGLNLTRANHVFHFDRWWNPAVENQATDRAFRIGQTRHVMVHKLISVGTVEEKIATLIAGKRQLADLVVASGEGGLTELSNAQLRELFTLEGV